MPWQVTDVSSTANAAGGRSTSVTSRNENGDTRTVERETDGAGRVIRQKESTREADGDRRSEETRTDFGPPVVVNKKTENNDNGVHTTEETETIGGVKRRRTTTTLYPNGDFFRNETTWDETGRLIGTHFHHTDADGDNDFDYHHPITRAVGDDLRDDLRDGTLAYAGLPQKSTSPRRG
jgi:hypothetical protein